MIVSGVARIWCKGDIKLRENNLRVTRKYYVILPYSNYTADVPEYTKYRIHTGFLLDTKQRGVEYQSLCGSEVT